jgi:hypothetical protein
LQKYPVRPSHRVRLNPSGLEELCRAHFENVSRNEGKVTANFGAIASLGVWPEGRELAVELTMNPQVPELVQQETIKRYNHFLEEATGFSSKERAKRVRKGASAPTPGA